MKTNLIIMLVSLNALAGSYKLAEGRTTQILTLSETISLEIEYPNDWECAIEVASQEASLEFKTPEGALRVFAKVVKSETWNIPNVSNFEELLRSRRFLFGEPKQGSLQVERQYCQGAQVSSVLYELANRENTGARAAQFSRLISKKGPPITEVYLDAAVKTSEVEASLLSEMCRLVGSAQLMEKSLLKSMPIEMDERVMIEALTERAERYMEMFAARRFAELNEFVDPNDRFKQEDLAHMRRNSREIRIKEWSTIELALKGSVARIKLRVTGKLKGQEWTDFVTEQVDYWILKDSQWYLAPRQFDWSNTGALYFDLRDGNLGDRKHSVVQK